MFWQKWPFLGFWTKIPLNGPKLSLFAVLRGMEAWHFSNFWMKLHEHKIVLIIFLNKVNFGFLIEII